VNPRNEVELASAEEAERWLDSSRVGHVFRLTLIDTGDGQLLSDMRWRLCRQGIPVKLVHIFNPNCLSPSPGLVSYYFRSTAHYLSGVECVRLGRTGKNPPMSPPINGLAQYREIYKSKPYLIYHLSDPNTLEPTSDSVRLLFDPNFTGRAIFTVFCGNYEPHDVRSSVAQAMGLYARNAATWTQPSMGETSARKRDVLLLYHSLLPTGSVFNEDWADGARGLSVPNERRWPAGPVMGDGWWRSMCDSLLPPCVRPIGTETYNWMVWRVPPNSNIPSSSQHMRVMQTRLTERDRTFYGKGSHLRLAVHFQIIERDLAASVM